jgi:hypothetical protein
MSVSHFLSDFLYPAQFSVFVVCFHYFFGFWKVFWKNDKRVGQRIEFCNVVVVVGINIRERFVMTTIWTLISVVRKRF